MHLRHSDTAIPHSEAPAALDADRQQVPGRKNGQRVPHVLARCCILHNMLLTVDGRKFDGRTPALRVNGHDSTRVGRAWPCIPNGHGAASVYIRENSNFVRKFVRK